MTNNIKTCPISWLKCDSDKAQLYDQVPVLYCNKCKRYSKHLYLIHSDLGDYICYKCNKDVDTRYFCVRCKHY